MQEWTLRVNMFESMLWACLATLRSEAGGGEVGRAASGVRGVWEVSPGMVAGFWGEGGKVDLSEQSLAGAGRGEVVDEGKKKVGKDAKIEVVRSWLEGRDRDSERKLGGGGDVSLEFSDEAIETADLFYAARAGRAWRQKHGVQLPEGMDKLDDLADCLLQGVAWVKWEENRRRLREMLEGKG